MKENFESFMELILSVEGGYVNDPDDSGGETNYGITIATYTEYFEPLYGRKPSSEDMKWMRIGDVRALYKKEYWDKVRGDDLPSGIDIIVADMAVNSGVHRAAVKLQGLFPLEADGIIGSQTVAAIKLVPSEWTLHNYFLARRSFYNDIGNVNKNGKFLKGWYNRLNAVYSLCHELVY